MSNQKLKESKSVNGSAGHKLRRINVNVIADYTTKSEDWKRFGYTEVNVMSTKNDQVVGKSGMKIEVQNNELRVALPESMTFIPHEAIDEMNAGLEKRLLDANPDLKKNGFKIERIIKKESHGGNTCHWVVQTNQVKEVKGSHEKEADKVKLGFTIRNGYNTSTSLGIDIFTFRLVCENGAFVRSKSLQKMSFKHVGNDPKKLFAEFATALMKATEDWVDVIKDYERMAVTKLNQKMIEYIYEKNAIIPDRFFPDYYQIADKEKLKANVGKDAIPLVAISAKGKTMTLWQNLNDMTKDVWRSTDDQTYKKKDGKEGTHKGIAFSEMAWRERRLHDSMAYILNNPEEFK